MFTNNPEEASNAKQIGFLKTCELFLRRIKNPEIEKQ